jgi:hypothetical protein
VIQTRQVRYVSKSFRTGRLERRELQMVQLSATRCSCIAILWVSIVSFAAISLRVASERVFNVLISFIDSVRKLLDTSSYSWILFRCCVFVSVLLRWTSKGKETRCGTVGCYLVTFGSSGIFVRKLAGGQRSVDLHKCCGDAHVD